MNAYKERATQLTTALGLALPPIAVALCDEAPEGVEGFDGLVPAGCAFWQEAATRTFVTTARDHALCSIGVHTHNLAGAEASQSWELQASLAAMTGLDYVREDEIAAIPVVTTAVRHAVYGPLAEFPVEPAVVLLFAHARQGLVLSEACERVDRGVPPAMGRPACAVIPHVINGGRAALSLGCCGARAYLDALSDDVALWALPASKLAEYCGQIRVLAAANATLSAFHEGRRKDVQAGGRPTVAESLLRLA